jgi:hypothetical protein
MSQKENLKTAISILKQVVDATVIKGGVLNTSDVVNSVNALNLLGQHVEELEKQEKDFTTLSEEIN